MRTHAPSSGGTPSTASSRSGAHAPQTRYGQIVVIEYEPKLGRIPIRALAPQQPGNLWPAKAYRGEVVPFEATVFREGHDLLGVSLVITSPGGSTVTHRMLPMAPGTDR